MIAVANNRWALVQKVIAVALSVLVQAAALSGPLVHAHPDDHATVHHHGRAVHTHWGGHAGTPHPSDTPAVDSPDHDRAVFLGAFVAEPPAMPVAPAIVQARFRLPVPAERPSHRPVEDVRSHDPPSVAQPSLRAPPSFLS